MNTQDEGRYQELLTHAMEEIDLSVEEALVLCEALKKRTEHATSLAGAVALEIEELKLDEKYGLDREGTRGLIFRLSRMPLLQRIAIMDATEKFWVKFNTRPKAGNIWPTELSKDLWPSTKELLCDVGLVGPKTLPADGENLLPVGAREQVVREVIDLLNNTRHAFKSKQVERARNLLEGLL